MNNKNNYIKYYKKYNDTKYNDTKILTFKTPIKNNINIILNSNNLLGNKIKNKIKNIYNFNFERINSIEPNILYQRLLTIKKYGNEKKVYNKMFQKAINNIQNFLRKDEKFYDNKKALIKQKSRINFVKTLDYLEKFKNINLNLSYKKLYYILFFYLGITRNLINILQQKTPNIRDLLCFFNDTFYDLNYGYLDLFNNINGRTHSLSMSRFDNYIFRLIYNNLMYNRNKINPGYVSTSCVFFKKNNEKYGLDRNNSYISTDYGSGKNIDSRVNTLNLILELFTKLDTEIITTVEEKKKCIVEIYYYIIILMPFNLGTASIAEMFLYSLWKFYIGTRLEIRQTIMLDVEALTSNFDVFYRNCFHNDVNENDSDNKTIYTPYFIEA